MDKSARTGKAKSRVGRSQDVLKKAEAALSAAESKRNERFGDAEMQQNAKEALNRAKYRLEQGKDALDMPDMTNCCIS